MLPMNDNVRQNNVKVQTTFGVIMNRLNVDKFYKLFNIQPYKQPWTHRNDVVNLTEQQAIELGLIRYEYA